MPEPFNPLPALVGPLVGCLAFWLFYPAMTDVMDLTGGRPLPPPGFPLRLAADLSFGVPLSVFMTLPSTVVCLPLTLPAAFVLHRLRMNQLHVWIALGLVFGLLLGTFYFRWFWMGVSEATDLEAPRRFLFMVAHAMAGSVLGCAVISGLSRLASSRPHAS